MKKMRFTKFMIFAFMAVVAAVAAWLSGVDLCGLFSAGSGVCLGMAAVVVPGGVTVEKTEELAGEVLDDDLEEAVLQMTRSRSPLNTIIKSMKKSRKTAALKHEYFAVDEKALNAKVVTAAAGNNSKVISVPVPNVDIFSLHDTVSFVGVSSYNDLNVASAIRPLVGRIVEIDNENGALKVQAVNGFRNDTKDPVFKDGIPADTLVVRMGRAEGELAMQTAPFALMPTKDYNLCQNFMAQILESEWSKLHAKKVNFGWSEFSALNLLDMAQTKELSYLLGARGKMKDARTKDDIYTCGGIIEFITKVVQHGNALTEDVFADWFQVLFDGNSGNPVRYAFLGSDLYKQVQKIKAVQKQIDGSREPFVAFGLEFDRIKFDGCTLLLHKHNLLGYCGMSNYGLCLDMDNIGEATFKHLHETELDLKKSGNMNADAKVIAEVCCPVVKYPDTHMLIMP